MKTFKRSFMPNDVFKNNDLGKVKYKEHFEPSYKSLDSMTLITQIIKQQNYKLLQKISESRDIDFEDLIENFYKTVYYTPLIISKEIDEVNQKNESLKIIKRKTKAHLRKLKFKKSENL
jgi:hypothetical protein